MTTPHAADPEDELLAEPSPVLVGGMIHIGHAVDTQTQGADFGSWATFTLPAGADVARPFLPYDVNRHRALIVVSAPGAVAAGSGVWVGTEAQCKAAPPVGGFLPPGSYAVESKSGLWLVGDGTNAMRVTVLMERWA